MSWHYLQEPEGGFSVERYLAGVALARLRSSNTPAACCSNGSETDCCPHSRFGTMCAPSTGDHGEGSWMSSPAGSPAKTSPAQEKVQDSPGREAGFGARCTELLARYDHAMHSWKTPQCSLLEGLDEFSETWPKSGMMLHGRAYLLPIAARRTSASASGFSQRTAWLTPMALDGERTKLKLESLAAHWALPTPMEFVRRFPTPCSHGKGGSNAAKKWKEILTNYPTPTCHDAKLAHPAPNKTAQGSPCLTERILEQETSGGTLNPTWVEWLMGWPLGWTDLKPLATDRFRSWLQQHSRC